MRLLVRSLAIFVVAALLTAACGSSDDDAASTSATDAEATSATIDGADLDSDSAGPDTSSADTRTDTDTDTAEAASEVEADEDGTAIDAVAALFTDGALTEDALVVDCTLENGNETSCYQFEVASLASTVATDGPFCPETISDAGGIWVWDGDEPGLYSLDAAFWTLMSDQGFEFVDADGNISITDPAAGAPGSSTTANSCLEATADGSFHLRVLIPRTPEFLDSPADLSTISQIGLALDGVTIFGDAPSVADRGGLPALDACGGHIDPSGYYHWHFGAESIQTNLDEAGAAVTCEVEQDPEAIVAFSYDGHAIYGPEEGGAIPSDLDECSGHVSDTDEFGEVYHYHLTYDSPNLPLCRVGAAAAGKLTSPDNTAAALPDGEGGGGGGPGGPPPGEG